MNAGALEDAGGGEDRYLPVAQSLRPIPALDLIVGLAREGSTTRVVLDPAHLATHLPDYAIRREAAFPGDQLEESFLDFWASFRDVEPDAWVEQAISQDRLNGIEDAVDRMVGQVRDAR